MDETAELLDIVGTIYEASYNSAQWVTVLQQVAKLTNSSSAALIFRDETYPRANFVYSYGIPAKLFHSYLGRYIHLDPFIQLIVKNLPCGTVSADHLLVSSRDELRKTSPEFYDEFMIPNDMYHIGGAGLLVDGDRMAAIAIQRKKALGSWTNEELGKLSALTDHFQRAFRIHREFIRLRVQEYAVYAMFDQLIIGLILLDTKSRPVYTNPTARSILKTHPALKTQGGKIATSKYEDVIKLENLISSAMNNNDIETMRGGVLGLHHPDSALPLLLLAIPVSDLKVAFQSTVEGAHVALFISDPERSQPISADALVETFELTRAEAGVTVSLVNGLSPKEIANAKNVSLETVRSQLKAVYRKTCTSSQADLIRLLLSGLFGAVQVSAVLESE